MKYHIIYTDIAGLHCDMFDEIELANEGLTEVYEKYMMRVDETTVPYVIYGAVAKIDVQCAIVG
jgi:hypothetical protein